MMHYNMVHLREVGKDNWLVHEEDTWYRTDTSQIIDLIDDFVGIGFFAEQMYAVDDTVLTVLYHRTLGWRVIQIRET